MNPPHVRAAERSRSASRSSRDQLNRGAIAIKPQRELEASSVGELREQGQWYLICGRRRDRDRQPAAGRVRTPEKEVGEPSRNLAAANATMR
jgi:hypothetical protein